MKTERNTPILPKKKLFFARILGLLLFTITLQHFAVAQDTPPPPPADDYSQPSVVTPPEWAPAYDNAPQVQYYYIPDIEVYYDVWHHEFVYLDGGNWLFSPTLPAMYAGFDLRNGHVVVLDRRVHQPWLHHELYVSHYPRYYHHVVYATGPHPHGFDENSRKAIYDTHTTVVVAPPARRTVVQYRDKNIGQPVHVEKNMMRPTVVERRK